MTEFSVVKISPAAFENVEEIEGGAAEKYRLNLPDMGKVILKLDDENLNGAWVEKITYELAKLIDLPTASYEFAELFDRRKAIVSSNYLLPNHNEQSGRMLLNRYYGENNYSYTVDTVLSIVDAQEIELPSGYSLPPEIQTAADLLVGYLIFDYWIDNIDRHYENWGIQTDSVTARKELLPTYDHGLSLGFLLFDEECLTLAPANHVQNQSSAFMGKKGRSLSMNEMLATLISLRSEAANFWIERVTQIEQQIVIELFECIPDGWISRERKLFAINLIEFNRQQLISVKM
jgi:hypothetical protein